MQNDNISKASRRTKNAVAAALKALISEKPLSRVTIHDITDYCEINRSTFYYHFFDKQDVINYIYHTEVTLPLRKEFHPGAEHWCRLSLFSLQLMYQSRDFYIQAFRISGQNDLSSFILSEVLENWRIVTDALIESASIPDRCRSDAYYISDYLAYGAFSMMKSWVLGGMKETPEKIAWLLDLAGQHGMSAYGLINSAPPDVP